MSRKPADSVTTEPEGDKPAEPLTTEGEPLTTEPVTEPVTEPTEPPADMSLSGSVGEPVIVTSQGDKPATEPVTEPADPQVAIDAFNVVALAAIGSADTATGTVPQVNVDAVKVAARSLKGASRSHPTTFLSEHAMSAMGDSRIAEAQAAMSLIKALAETKVAKPASDPIADAVSDMLSLHYRGADRLALLTDDAARTAVAEKVAALLAESPSKPEGFAFTSIVSKPRAARAEGDGTVARSAKGEPKGLGKVPRHVLAVLSTFAADGSAMTHGAIAGKASDIYPDASCSQGAIAAAMKGEPILGTVAVDVTKTQKDGKVIVVNAIRLAEPVTTEPEGEPTEPATTEPEGDN